MVNFRLLVIFKSPTFTIYASASRYYLGSGRSAPTKSRRHAADSIAIWLAVIAVPGPPWHCHSPQTFTSFSTTTSSGDTPSGGSGSALANRLYASPSLTKLCRPPASPKSRIVLGHCPSLTTGLSPSAYASRIAAASAGAGTQPSRHDDALPYPRGTHARTRARTNRSKGFSVLCVKCASTGAGLCARFVQFHIASRARLHEALYGRARRT